VEVAVGVRRAVVQGERRVAGVFRQALEVGASLRPPADPVGLAFGQFRAHREVGLRQVEGCAVVASRRLGLGHGTVWVRGRPDGTMPLRTAAGTGGSEGQMFTGGDRAVSK